LGGTSRSCAGIHPVEAIRNSGNANILASLAPERDQKSRMRMAQSRSTALILNGDADSGKLRRLRLFGESQKRGLSARELAPSEKAG